MRDPYDDERNEMLCGEEWVDLNGFRTDPAA